MKVKFKNMMNGYTGVVDDIVIYYMKRLNRCVIRSRPVKHANQSQTRLAAIMHNLKLLHPSEGYKSDLKAYLEIYQQTRFADDDPVCTWNNLFLRLMYDMQRHNPEIDLQTLSRAEIYALDLPCISVKSAVEAGLLRSVNGYEGWTQQI